MIEGLDLIKQTQKIHDKLNGDFKKGLDEDVKIAQELQDFLNWVVYDTKKQNENNPEILKGLLTEDLKEELKSNGTIRLFQEPDFSAGGNKSNIVGTYGEEGFSKIITQIILQGREEIAEDFKNKTIDALAGKTIVGKKQTTVEVPKKMAQLVQQKLIEVNNSEDKYVRYYLKQGKVDINMAELKATGTFNEAASKLLDLTASVKNSNDFLIKLETLNRKKAYFAIMKGIAGNNLTGSGMEISDDEIEELYKFYFVNAPSKQDEFVASHINHMSQIYALTGYGQMSYENATTLILEKYARFLFYNNYKAKEIIIKSTKDIVIKQILEDKADNSRFKQRSSGKIKYYLGYYLTK